MVGEKPAADAPEERLRKRLNELRVGKRPIEPDVGVIADHSPDAIGVRILGGSDVELADRTGKWWIGTAETALAALEGMEPTGKPADVWDRLRGA